MNLTLILYSLKTLLIITVLSGCSTYIKSTKKINNEVTEEHVKNSIEGFYHNHSESSTLWSTVSTKKTKGNNPIKRKIESETVEVIQISPKMIKLRLFYNKSISDSLYIKGSFKGDRFEFKTRKYIEDLFPLFWTYTKTKYSIQSDRSSNLILTTNGWSLNFLLIAPLMGADGSLKSEYKRK